MSTESFFLDVAKIAITIAGFVGVVAALRHRREEEWKLNELYGVKLMIEHSLAAVLAGLLPSVLSLAFTNKATVWRLCSALLAAFFAFEVLINIFRVKHSTAAGTRLDRSHSSSSRSLFQHYWFFTSKYRTSINGMARLL